jgi:hypothetical protein
VSKGKVAIGVSGEQSTERIGWLQRQDSVALGELLGVRVCERASMCAWYMRKLAIYAVKNVNGFLGTLY